MKPIQVGLLGIGTVGSGVFNVLQRNQQEIQRRAGRGIAIGMVADLDTQRARTQVQVDDGATTIIGGIFVTREQVSNERTPGLYRLPLLGWLFKRDTTSDESRELLIFITPRIIRG